MTIEIRNETTARIDEREFVELSRFVFEAMHLHPATEMSIMFIDEEAMEKLHVQWMGEPGATDVLSFPMDELIPGSEEQPAPEGLLGDVVLCPTVAARQAAEAGHSAVEEMLLLTCHSILHLLGYDHMEDDERTVMFDLQRKLLLTFLASRRESLPSPCSGAVPTADDPSAADPDPPGPAGPGDRRPAGRAGRRPPCGLPQRSGQGAGRPLRPHTRAGAAPARRGSPYPRGARARPGAGRGGGRRLADGAGPAADRQLGPGGAARRRGRRRAAVPGRLRGAPCPGTTATHGGADPVAWPAACGARAARRPGAGPGAAGGPPPRRGRRR